VGVCDGFSWVSVPSPRDQEIKQLAAVDYSFISYLPMYIQVCTIFTRQFSNNVFRKECNSDTPMGFQCNYRTSSQRRMHAGERRCSSQAQLNSLQARELPGNRFSSTRCKPRDVTEDRSSSTRCRPRVQQAKSSSTR
jgi:hypothetical protein